MDTLSAEQRSERMSRIRGRNSAPELRLRRLVHGLGYRYRLYGKLPGKPDLVFAGKKKVIFMHGCFWHRHEGCILARLPKSKVEFWIEKLEANKLRDQRNIERLEALGWSALTIWECQMSDMDDVERRVTEFLKP